MVFYLSVAQLEELHDTQISHYGGARGQKDRGALEAAAARPAMTFAGEDLYSDIAAKAAALMHSLVMNRPVVDGNKRVGAHAALLFLALNGARWEIPFEKPRGANPLGRPRGARRRIARHLVPPAARALRLAPVRKRSETRFVIFPYRW